MAIRLIIAYTLNLFDFVITTYWINKYGIEIEGNPVGRWLYETSLACPVKIVGIGILLAVLYYGIKTHPKWKWTSWLVLAVYGALALYHIILAVRVAFVSI